MKCITTNYKKINGIKMDMNYLKYKDSISNEDELKELLNTQLDVIDYNKMFYGCNTKKDKDRFIQEDIYTILGMFKKMLHTKEETNILQLECGKMFMLSADIETNKCSYFSMGMN